MAIVSIAQIWTGREADEDDKSKRRATQVYQIITDDRLEDPGAILTLVIAGLPIIGDVYSTSYLTDSELLCIRRKASHDQDDPFSYMVTCEFSTDQRDPEDQQDPLERATKISFGFETFQRRYTHDVNGDPILLSNNRPPKDGIEGDDSRPVITFQRFEEFDPQTQFALWTEYRDAVNSDTFFGFEPGRCKIKSIKATPVFTHGQALYDVTYEIAFRPNTGEPEIDSWQPFFLDADTVFLSSVYRQIDGTLVNQYVDIVDVHGNPVTDPVPLDGNGAKLTLSTPPSPDDLVYNEAQIYASMPFAALNLP